MDLFVLIAIAIGAIGLIAFLFKSNTPKSTVTQHKSIQLPESKPVNKPAPGERRFYAKEEVAKHNTRTDCWLIIEEKETKIKKVYDVSSYVDAHVGQDAILNNAGANSTIGFYGEQHPVTVFEMVKEYYIGDLKE